MKGRCSRVYLLDIYMNFMDEVVTYFTDLLTKGGPFFGVFIILLESIFPILPLGVFIAFNMHAFGKIFGFLLSWLATCLGCFGSYFIFSHWVSSFLDRLVKKHHKQLQKMKKKICKLPFSNLVLLIALPFTPAFLINIACGLSKIPTKKFIMAILLGKLSIVFFWGFVGTSLIESVTDITTIMIVVVLLLVSYFLSKIVSHKMEIE